MSSSAGDTVKLSVFGEPRRCRGLCNPGLAGGGAAGSGGHCPSDGTPGPGGQNRYSPKGERHPRILSGCWTAGPPALRCAWRSSTRINAQGLRRSGPPTAARPRRLYRPRAVSRLQRYPGRRTFQRPADRAAGVCRGGLPSDPPPPGALPWAAMWRQFTEQRMPASIP